MTPRCELTHCLNKRQRPARVFVNETIGDGSYLVGICLPDANALGLRDGDEMPPADEVRKTLKKARKNCHQATVVLA